MADYKIQRGTTSITGANTTASISAGTDYTAPSAATKAFIRITNVVPVGAGPTDEGSNNNGGEFNVWINNPSNIVSGITFEREDSGGDVVIAWEIWEYVGSAGGSNEMLVRSATTLTFSGGSDTQKSTSQISGISDDSDVVVFITGVGIGDNLGKSTQFTAEWIGSGTDVARLTRADTRGSGVVSIAVVEFTGSNWSVQRVEHSYTAGGTTQTESITSVGSLSKAFIEAQYRGNGSFPRDSSHLCWLSAVDTVSFYVDTLGSASPTGVAWVIENTQSGGTTDMSVQRVSNTRSAQSTGNADSWTETITTVSSLQEAAVTGITGINSTGNTDYYNEFAYNARLTATNTVTLDKARDGVDTVYRFEVVEFPEEAGGDTTAPTLSSPTASATSKTTASGSVSTDEANGTLYWVATTSATAPSVAQVQAGQDHTGASAPDSGSQSVTATGTQNVSVDSLTAGTTYYLHFQHQDAATNDSSVASSSAFTTDSLVSREGQTLFNTLDAVAREGQTLFNTLDAVAREGQTLFDTLDAISREAETRFGVGGVVAREGEFTFLTLDAIARESQTLFDTLDAIAREAQTSFHARSLAYVDAVVSFNIMDAVAREGQALFDTLASVGREGQTAFNVLDAIAREGQTAFNVLTPISRECQTLFDTLASVAREGQTLFDVRSVAPREAQILYDVLSTLASVSREAGTAFHTRAPVSREGQGLFYTLAAVRREVEFLSHLRATIAREAGVSFETLTGVSREGTVRFYTPATVSRDGQFLFNVAATTGTTVLVLTDETISYRPNTSETSYA